MPLRKNYSPQQIIAGRIAGKTLSKIAQETELSKEWVRQILKAKGFPSLRPKQSSGLSRAEIQAKRFWERVDKFGPLPDQSNSHYQGLGRCWTWMGCLSNGYGTVQINNQRRQAHAWSWEQVNGPITNGSWLLHKCDNKVCVNPDHLTLGTAKDNVADAIAKGRRITARKKLTRTCARCRELYTGSHITYCDECFSIYMVRHHQLNKDKYNSYMNNYRQTQKETT